MAQSMTLSAADAVAIEALIVEHNWRTDHAPPGEVADLYEENCVVTGLINAQGREALRRLAEQVPTNLRQRHLTTNLRLLRRAEGVVDATSITTVYAHAGEGGDTIPQGLIDSKLSFRKGKDGWRFAKRHDEFVHG